MSRPAGATSRWQCVDKGQTPFDKLGASGRKPLRIREGIRFYNLPNAWQIGTNPTITYDDKATSGNEWNVPLGLTVTKTTRVSGLPVKLQVGIEYSVVSPDDFGQRAQFKLNLIPVIPSLVEAPILGDG